MHKLDVFVNLRLRDEVVGKVGGLRPASQEYSCGAILPAECIAKFLFSDSKILVADRSTVVEVDRAGTTLWPGMDREVTL